jgi:hypothetical protein
MMFSVFRGFLLQNLDIAERDIGDLRRVRNSPKRKHIHMERYDMVA